MYLYSAGKIENVTFNDILPCVRQSVSELQDQGVNKIIALGHSGYSFSQQVAEIPGVDIVIDGHSHTFLYTGKSSPVPEAASVTDRKLWRKLTAKQQQQNIYHLSPTLYVGVVQRTLKMLFM